MKNATEMKKISFKNNALVDYLEGIIASDIEEAAKQGDCSIRFEIPTRPCPNLTKIQKFELINEYMRQFGYTVGCNSRDIITIEW